MTDWKARAKEIAAADGVEWERLVNAYDRDWEEAYRAEFRRFAALRGWTDENIESGWLDDMPHHALISVGYGSDPAETARNDVFECEWESSND